MNDYWKEIPLEYNSGWVMSRRCVLGFVIVIEIASYSSLENLMYIDCACICNPKRGNPGSLKSKRILFPAHRNSLVIGCDLCKREILRIEGILDSDVYCWKVEVPKEFL
jgi:hypothetical protein